MKTYLTKDGKVYYIRQPDEGDAEELIRYSKILFDSTDQVLTTPEEYTISVEEQKIWIEKFTFNPDAAIYIAELDGEIIGLLFFASGTKKKTSHTGEFGVNVHPFYQGLGIGRKLIETLLNWAKAHPKIQKISLNVFATNAKAINLYKNMGFKEEGRFIKAIKQPSGAYVDIIQMYTEVQ